MVRNTLAGKYEIVGQIGAGGMGVVYEARRVADDTRVAVKVLPAFMVMKDESRLARFHREAKTTASIDNEHVARILETGEDPGTGEAFMVMELLQGEDLERLLSRVERVSPAIVLNIVGQVCMGLAAAHAARIIHRDIKPANLFLARGEDGTITVKILDFGIAKIKAEPGADTTGMTRSGSMLGSPLYMSPEQARGIKEIDFRTDIWSLGVVLYRALSGTAPHEGISAFGDLIMAICSRTPEPVQARAPWVPPEIASIVHRALRLEPEKRFQHAEEMLAELRKLAPEGFALTEDMLAPVSEGTRARVAPRYEATTEPDGRRAAVVRASGEVDTSADTIEEEAPQPSIRVHNKAEGSVDTVERAAITGAKPPPSTRSGGKSSWPLIALLGVVGIGSVGATARMLAGNGNAPSGSGTKDEAHATQAPTMPVAPEATAPASAEVASPVEVVAATAHPIPPSASASAASSAASAIAEPQRHAGTKIAPRGNTPSSPSAAAPPPRPTAAPAQIHDEFE